MQSQPQAHDEASGEAPVRTKRRLALDEDSIDFLGRAARGASLPEDSLTQTPVRTLASGMENLVKRLTTLNVNRLIRHQGLLSRLTGADIEARMRFEIEVRQTTQDIRDLYGSSRNARRIRADLLAAARDITAEQDRLQRIIAAGRRVLDAAPPHDDPEQAHLRERFERRLNNLVALETSNTLTCQQIALAGRNMVALIDRVEEVCTTVFRLWQRDALAIALSTTPVARKSPLIEAFLRSHDTFIAQLATSHTAPGNPT